MRARLPDKPTVLITDAGRGSAIAFIRSLGRKGWNVIAADCHRLSPGLHSRYARQRLLYPSPATAPREMVDALCHAARRQCVDLIIPVTDEVILPLSRERARFGEICRLAMPATDALEAVGDKLQTIELARHLRVPVPATESVSTVEEALHHGPRLGWPVVLKPAASRLYDDGQAVQAFRVAYAQDPADLARQMQQFERRCPVLLQQYTPGIGCGVELLLDRGRPLAAFQHRRLREVPVNGGASSLRQSVPLDPALYDHATRLLGELQWTGLAMVEFKHGRQGPMLMEINGRVWGSLPLAVLSGMDFPARMAELWLFGPPTDDSAPATSYRSGVVARNLELDMVWIASVLAGWRRYPFLPMPRRREALAALAGLLSPACKCDILSLADPLPGVAELLKIAGKLITKGKRFA